MVRVPFSALSSCELRVDAIYEGGRSGNSRDDPLHRLLGVSNSGGFRYRGSLASLQLLVLTSSSIDPDWPDGIDRETGVFTYFGDNKRPGRDLHATPRFGNEILRRLFDLTHEGETGRMRVPPIFVFSSAGEGWRDVAFLGLAVPGTSDARGAEDLVAIWRVTAGKRFQNYRARFTLLDASSLQREWIEAVIAGSPNSDLAPPAWRDWVRSGRYRPLIAEKSRAYRTRSEQLPKDSVGGRIITAIREFCVADPHLFEGCAVGIARLMLPNISRIDITRRSRDGGRDAVGHYRIGQGASSVQVDFALEAKCYAANKSVGVRELSRLISRLRHRQFGVLVTTSFLDLQAYKEVIDDQHPIVIISAVDIADTLRANGYAGREQLLAWLMANAAAGS